MSVFDSSFLEDPYPTYASLRLREPFHEVRSLSGRMLLLSRACDVREVLKSADFNEYDLPAIIEMKHAALGVSDSDLKLLGSRLKNWLFFMSGGDHQHLRRAIAPLYSARRIELIREAISAEIARALSTRQDIDAIGTLAKTLPATAGMSLLGIPMERRDEITEPASIVLKVFEPLQRLSVYGDIAAGFGTMDQILVQLQVDDALEALGDEIKRGMGDQELSDSSIRSIAIMLFAAGQDTISGAISNSLALLANRPEILFALRRSPTLIPAMARELIRYDPPVQIVARVAAKNTVVAGRPIQQGDRVSLVLASACRDPEEFDEPDKVDITRRRGTSLAFGLGRHFCVGAQLAFLVIEELLRHASQFEAVEVSESSRRRSIVFRGHVSMTVSFRGEK